jgi:purine-binding chemotaxis protein CheW
VPRSPEFVENIIKFRGKVIPIIDLRKRFNLDVNEHDNNTRVVVVIEGQTMGMVVDSVSEVLRIPASTIKPTPDVAISIESEYIRGVAKLDNRLLIHLDLSRILSGEEQNVLTQM